MVDIRRKGLDASIRLLTGVAAGAGAAYCVADELAVVRPLIWPWELALTAVLLASTVWLAVDRLLLLPTWRRLGERWWLAKSLWVLGAVATGCLLVIVIPLHLPPAPTDGPRVLEIRATGDKNPSSVASEVWLLEVRPAGPATFDPRNCRVAGDWMAEDGLWDSTADVVRSLGQRPASVRCLLPISGDASLRFVSHDWSGVVEVVWRGNVTRIDLYDSIKTERTLFLPQAGDGRTPGRARPWLSRLALGVCLAPIVLFVLVGLVTWRGMRSRIDTVPRWEWLVYSLLCAGVWSVWWLAFWPGVVSFDALNQWSQMSTGHYSDWHPAILALMMWLVTRIWLSPAAVVSLQIVILSLLVGWSLGRFRTRGLPRLAAIVLCLLFALNPLTATLVTSVLKDTAYAVALLAMTLCLWEIVAGDEAWLSHRLAWLTLGLVSSGVALFRHNGWPLAFVVLLVFAAVYRSQRRQLLAALGVAVIVWLGVRGPVYQAVGVRYSTSAANWPFVASSPGPWSSEPSGGDRARWKWPYHCLDSPSPKSAPATVAAPVGQVENDGPRVSVADRLSCLLRPDLGVLAKTRAFIWQITKPAGKYYEAYLFWLGEGNQVVSMDPRWLDQWWDVGLRPASKAPALERTLANWCARTAYGDGGVAWFLWRPALYMYLGVAGGVVSSLRARNWRFILVMAPLALQSALMLALAPDWPLMRLQLPVVWIGLLFGGFLLVVTPARVLNVS